MNKTTLLTGSVLSIALLAPAIAQAQSAMPSRAYGTPQPTYATSSTSSSSTSSTYAGTQGYFAPMTDRILTDPLYLPLHGQIEGITAYTLGFPSSSTYNYKGVDRVNSNSVNNTFTQTVQYGVTDDFALRINESYGFGHGYSDNQINGVDNSSSTNGFENPTLGATYRFIDQRHNYPVDATFDVTYSPDMIDAQSAGNGNSGNEGSGRQTANFTADVGREMRNFTIDAFTGATYEGKRQAESLATYDTADTDPFWNYFVGLRTQVRFTERLSLNADYRWTAQGDTQTSNNTTGVFYNQSNPDFSDFTVALNYHFIPDRLVGQLSYDYYDYSNSSNTYPTSPTSNTTTENQNNNIVGVRLFYVFN